MGRRKLLNYRHRGVVIGLAADGCRGNEIADELGVSRRTLGIAMRAWGIRLTPGHGVKAGQRSEVLFAVGRGLSGVRTIAGEVGLARTQVERILAELEADGLVARSGISRRRATIWRLTDKWAPHVGRGCQKRGL